MEAQRVIAMAGEFMEASYYYTISHADPDQTRQYNALHYDIAKNIRDNPLLNDRISTTLVRSDY